MTRLCALQVTLLYLQIALSIQLSRLAAGNYEQLPWLAPMFQLSEYVRLGICEQTSILDYAELPDLRPLLDRLPLPMRTRLAQAISEERAGQVRHPSLAAGALWEEAPTLRLRARRLV